MDEEKQMLGGKGYFLPVASLLSCHLDYVV